LERSGVWLTQAVNLNKDAEVLNAAKSERVRFGASLHDPGSVLIAHYRGMAGPILELIPAEAASDRIEAAIRPARDQSFRGRSAAGQG